MADLWVLVPSRGRPAAVERLGRACALTCTARTRLHFAFDDDDPELAANIAMARKHRYRYVTGPRAGLVNWTNDLAARHVKRGDAAALASIGDDMVPVTHGWDTRLLRALGRCGMSYPDDELRNDVPEAVVMSTAIVAALGWMALPDCAHWYIDDAWRDLGHGAGCLRWCPEVKIKHLNHRAGAPVDATYTDAARTFEADGNAYRSWRLRQMPRDIATVRGAVERAAA